MKNQMLIEQVTLTDLRVMISDAIGTEMQKYFTPATKSVPSTPILTRQEAAKILNVSLPTLYSWTKEGKIKGTRIGTRVRYRLSDIEAALVDIDNLKYR